MPKYDFSLIATTFNQPRDLELYLKSLVRQSRDDFEILIADDGSGDETRDVIGAFQKRFFGDRLRHIWHQDTGYRKAKILNEAVRQSGGRWLVFTDSDLILHPRFIHDHVSVAEPKSVFMGRRVDLNSAVSDWVRSHPEQLFSVPFYLQVIRSGFSPSPSRNIQRSFRITSPACAKIFKTDRVPDLLGSNFSVDRELLFRINGFDESNEHYWGEDGDLFVRVRNSGAKIHGRKNFAVQFHLWHPLRSPKPGAEEAYKNKLTQADYIVCKTGLHSN